MNSLIKVIILSLKSGAKRSVSSSEWITLPYVSLMVLRTDSLWAEDGGCGADVFICGDTDGNTFLDVLKACRRGKTCAQLPNLRQKLLAAVWATFTPNCPQNHIQRCDWRVPGHIWSSLPRRHTARGDGELGGRGWSPWVEHGWLSASVSRARTGRILKHLVVLIICSVPPRGNHQKVAFVGPEQKKNVFPLNWRT